MWRWSLVCFAVGTLGACGDESGAGPGPAGADAGTDVAVTADVPAADGAEIDAAGERDVVEAPSLLRLVQISDTHVDGEGLTRANDLLAESVAATNTLDPPPDVVLVTGDLVDIVPADVAESGRASWLGRFQSLMNGLEVPWLAVAGNHEYYSAEHPYHMADDPAVVDAYLESILGWPPYHAHDVHGVRLILLHTLNGPLWNVGEGLSGALSVTQLAWLREQLAGGLPSLVFMHHPPDGILAEPDDDSLRAVVRDHPGVVKGIFSGHVHRFLEAEFEGVPSYTVASTLNGPGSRFVIEYDRVADRLDLVNSDEFEFTTLNEYACEPGVDPPLGAPGDLVDTVLRLSLSSPMTDAVGMGSYVGEILKALPMLVLIGAWDPAEGRLDGLMTVAKPNLSSSYWYDYLDAAPCMPIVVGLDDPCVRSEPVGFAFDVLSLLYLMSDEPVDPAWRLRLDVTDLWIEAVAVRSPEGPGLEAGLLHATVDGTRATADAHAIVVEEYCAGQIDGCVPGSDDAHPACPPAPDDAFFDRIPTGCDVRLAGFTLRTALALLGPNADEPIHVDANLRALQTPPSAEPGRHRSHPDLFSTEDGSNCAERAR